MIYRVEILCWEVKKWFSAAVKMNFIPNEVAKNINDTYNLSFPGENTTIYCGQWLKFLI